MSQYISITQETADQLAAKINYKRQLSGEPLEQIILAELQALAGEQPTLVIETSGIQKQTSPEISSMAAKYMGIKKENLLTMDPDAFISDVRRMAASLVSQDETKGQG